MEDIKVIISVGEAKDFYLKNIKSPRRELAERLLLETNLSIIKDLISDEQKLAFENASEAIRVNFRNLLSKGISKKWRGINMDDTLFCLMVNFSNYLNIKK